MLGRRLGRELRAQARPAGCGSPRSASSKVEDFFRRHGGKTIFIGRWVGFVRPLMPFTAGTSGMSYRRFLPYDVLGAGLWGATWCLLGYIFWRSFEQVAEHRRPRRDRVRRSCWRCSSASTRRSSACATPSSARAFAALARAPDASGRCCARSAGSGARLWIALRPLWRYVLRPLWRADRAAAALSRRPRSRPGELGIELTTLLAIAGVSHLHGRPADRPARDATRCCPATRRRSTSRATSRWAC